MIADVLILKDTVVIARETISSDGMGGTSAVTTLTTLGAAQIWQNVGSARFFSDKINAVSSHVLAAEPGGYAWADTDRFVVYASDRYEIVGRPDNVSQKSVLELVALEIIT